MSRYHIVYSFPDGKQNDLYITAASVEDGFNQHKRMWKCWGVEISFISSEIIR